MQHVNTSIVGAAGVLAGAVAGVGAASVLTGESAPAVQERLVVVSAGTAPEEPDRLVQWLKAHPRSR